MSIKTITIKARKHTHTQTTTTAAGRNEGGHEMKVDFVDRIGSFEGSPGCARSTSKSRFVSGTNVEHTWQRNGQTS